MRRALKDVNGRLELGPTKTHAQRTISLPAFLKEMLREHLTGPTSDPRRHRAGGVRVHGEGWRAAPHEPRVLAVLQARGRGLDGCSRSPLRPARCRPRLAGLRFHDLRHTCAALSIAAGAHPKLISARLGHSSIQVTLDRYGHLFPSMEEALADALDAAFVAGDAEQVGNVARLRP